MSSIASSIVNSELENYIFTSVQMNVSLNIYTPTCVLLDALRAVCQKKAYVKNNFTIVDILSHHIKSILVRDTCSSYKVI
jgi:hypothetical protein